MIEKLQVSSTQIGQTVADLLANSPNDPNMQAEKQLADETLAVLGTTLNTLRKARDDLVATEQEAGNAQKESSQLLIASQELSKLAQSIQTSQDIRTLQHSIE